MYLIYLRSNLSKPPANSKMPRILLIVTLIALLSACKVITPEVPHLPASTLDTLPLPDSKIDVPITIDLDSIFADLDRRIPAELNGSGNLGPGQYRYGIQRPPFTLSWSGTTLDLTDHAQGSAGGYIKNPLTKNWTKVCHCDFNVDLGINAGFTLADNYTLSAHARLTRFDADACQLTLANFDATPVIRSAATEAISKALDHLNDDISRYDIRKLVQPYWAKLFQPVKIDDIGYISLNPSQIRLENLNGSAHQLTGTIGITAKPVFSLANPGPPTVIPPLPVISRQDASGFNVYIDARIQYAELNRLAKAHLDNNKIAVGKTGYFMIKNAEIYGIGNNHLLIRIDFKGKQNGLGYRGRLYFTCLPVYDTASGQFYISDIDFDTHTREKLLAKAGDWILNSAIKTFLHDQIHFDLGAQVNSVKEQLNALLNKPIGPNIRLAGHIDSLSLLGILPVKDYMLMRFNTTGTLSVNKD
jgi:Domain of unknown function (DUF4403)